jgi:hypothetical protein
MSSDVQRLTTKWAYVHIEPMNAPVDMTITAPMLFDLEYSAPQRKRESARHTRESVPINPEKASELMCSCVWSRKRPIENLRVVLKLIAIALTL